MRECITHHWCECKQAEIERLKKERDNLRQKVIKYEFRLNYISENTECIGLEKCHVDGNCIHCLATVRGEK